MQSKMNVKDLDLCYGDFKALHNINLDIIENEILSFIGPSGCGKSTLLKCLNRMNDLVVACRIEGEITLDGEDIYAKNYDVNKLRKRVGMVFQQPNPFPMSIYENIAYGPKTHGIKNKTELDEIVESSLKQAAIWDEVKDDLKKSALSISGGQQQRVSIARAFVGNPNIIFADEPTGNLDTKTSFEIMELIKSIVRKNNQTLIMVTHDEEMTEFADRTLFMRDGLIEKIHEKLSIDEVLKNGK